MIASFVVARLPSLRQALGDAQAVLARAVAAELEFGLDRLDVEPDASDRD
jgi:hypothetical protein